MASEAVLDQFGRVVIPKKTRDQFGLEPGDTLMVDERQEGILLRPQRGEAALRRKGHVLVYSGEPSEAASDVLRRQREERLGQLMPRRRRR